MKNTASNWAIGSLLAVVVVLVIFGSKPATHKTTREGPPPKKVISLDKSPQTPSTGNPSHDQLLAFSASERAEALGKAVDDECVGKDSFFMGIGKDLCAYWSVRCSNGKNYLVTIEADAKGSTKTLDCGFLKVIAKTQCFKKFDEQ